MAIDEYLASIDTPYFQNGLLSRVKIGEDLKIQSSITGRLYPLSQSGLQSAFFDTAKVGVNEAQILAGSLLDPFGYEHLAQTNTINEFLQRATSNTTMQQVLEDIGLSSLNGRRIEVERLSYSNITSISSKFDDDGAPYVTRKGGVTIGKEPRGLRIKLRELHKIQNAENSGFIINPDFVSGGGQPRYIPLPEISLEGALDEQSSTWGFLTTRKDIGTGLRYRFVNEEGNLTYLTQAQATRLRISMGGETIARSAMLKLGLKNPFDLNNLTQSDITSLTDYSPLQLMGGLFQKLDKRVAATTSARDFSLAEGGLDSLIQESLSRLKTEKTGMYGRLEKLGALPKNLDDLMINIDYTQSRLLEAFKFDEEKTLFQDFTDKAIAANGRDELKLTATLRAIKGAGQEEINISERSIRGILSEAGIGEDGFQSLGKILKQYYDSPDGGSNFQIGKFIEHLKTLSKTEAFSIDGLSVTDLGIIARKLSDGERVYDGSGVFAQFVIDHQLNINKDRMELLKGFIDRNEAEPEAVQAEISSRFGERFGIEHVKKTFKDIQNATRKIKESHDDLTGRFGLTEGGGKGVFDIRDIGYISDDLGVVGFASKELFKNETNFGKANFELFGEEGRSGQYITFDAAVPHSEERVFSDFQASIFQSEVYSDPELIKQVQENIGQWTTEMETMRKTGIVSDSVMRRISAQAGIDPEDFEQLGFASRANAARYRNDAMEIQNVIMNSNARVDALPSLFNKIIDASSKDVFRLNKQYRSGVKTSGFGRGGPEMSDLFAGVLPRAQRNAVDTEENLAGRQDFAFDRGRDVETVLLGENAYKEVDINTINQGDEVLKMAKYRHDGHKILVSGSAVDQLYEAKGGFDLDDKFITDLHYIEDAKGRKRLAAFAWRQPTGPEEFSILAPQMDSKTLQRLFSGNDPLGENFRTALNDFTTKMMGKEDQRWIDLVYTGKDMAAFEAKLAGSGMSEEQRAVRYLNAISRNHLELADVYRNSGNKYISDDIIEDTVVKIQSESKSGLNKLSEKIIAKTVVDKKTNKRMFTSTQLTQADLAENPELIPGYRNNRKIAIEKTSLTLTEDDKFISEMRDIAGRYSGYTDPETGKIINQDFDYFHELFSTNLGEGAGWTETKTAHAIASMGMRSEDESLKQEILAQMDYLKTRVAENASAQKGGNLAVYINTLGFTNSFDRQMDDVLKQLSPADANFFRSTYFASTPEGAIDTAIGGSAKVNMTQFLEEVAESHAHFNNMEYANSEISSAKAYFQLHKKYRENIKEVLGNKKSVLDEYEGLEEFTEALKNDATKSRILEEIEVQSQAVAKNMILQTGMEFGRLRAAYHAGILPDNDALRVGIDELVFRVKGASHADVESLLEGIRIGTQSFNERFSGSPESKGFQDFIDSSLEDWRLSKSDTRDPNSKEITETYTQKQEAIIDRLFGKSEDSSGIYSLGYANEAVKLQYSSSNLERSLSGLTELKNNLKMARTGDRTFASELSRRSQASRDLNVSGALSQITHGDLLTNVDSLGSEGETTSINLIDKISTLNKHISIVENNLNFNSQSIGADVDRLLKNHGSLSASMGLLHSPSDKLEFVQNRLIADRAKYEQEARSLIYENLKAKLEDTEKPVSARSLLEQYYITSQEFKASKEESSRALGNLMENALSQGESFFGGEGRLPLNEAYLAVQFDLNQKVTQRVAQQEEVYSSLISRLEGQARQDLEEPKNMSERLGRIFSPGESTYSSEKSSYVNEEFENIFPNLTSRGKNKQSIRDLINEALVEKLGSPDDEQAQQIEHFTQYMYSRDKEVTLDLIKKDLTARSFDEEQQFKYLNELRFMEQRVALNGATASEKALKLLDTFNEPIKNPIPIFNDIASEYLSREIRDARAGFGDIAGPTYKRIGSALEEKFPNFLNYAKGNKTKIALGIGIAALGGAVYNKLRKRDHTAEGVAGPPLLPGGSAYERPATENMEYPSFSPTSNGDLGVSYNVDIAGSQDQMQKFINASQSVSESGSNATIYSGIPNAGKDPYREIASSY